MGGWEPIKEHFNDQQCVSSCHPFQPSASIISPGPQYPDPPHLPQMTCVIQDTFLQLLPQLLHWMDMCSLPGTGPGRNLAGKGDVLLGCNLLSASNKGVREGGRGEAESWTCLRSLTTCWPSPGFTDRRAVCLSEPQGTLEGHLQPPPSSFSLL